MQFQYNICFGSTLYLTKENETRDHFNTTFVSVRPSRLSSLAFSNFISIQHLFRFDKRIVYHDFFWSCQFQYNICFGSTIVFKCSTAKYQKFQYNICFGSTCKANIFESFRIISIQHLFRFDLRYIQINCFSFYYFNTTFVSVRLK